MDKATRQEHQEVNPNLIIDYIVCFVCKAWSRPSVAAEAARFIGVDSYKVVQDWGDKKYIPDEFRLKILEYASLKGVPLTLYERFYLQTGSLELARSVRQGVTT